MEFETTIKFAKVRPTAKIPTKRDEDMGYDIYADFEEDYIAIAPHETKLIPTGIASACSDGWGFILKERGSTGSKGMALRCGVIDSGYRNEWFVCITNNNTVPVFIAKKGAIVPRIINKIYPYEKAIAQCIIEKVPKALMQEVSYDELKEIKSERGMGALGSSNK